MVGGYGEAEGGVGCTRALTAPRPSYHAARAARPTAPACACTHTHTRIGPATFLLFPRLTPCLLSPHTQAYKGFLNEKVRMGRERRNQRMQQHAQTKRERTQSTKADIAAWEASHEASRQAHLARSREMAQNRAAERKAAKERNDAKAAQRREAARAEKANDAVATEALAAEVRHNQLMRARSYARRYVPTSEVEHLEASDTFRRLYGLTDANGEIKAVTRESLGSSPGKK